MRKNFVRIFSLRRSFGHVDRHEAIDGQNGIKIHQRNVSRAREYQPNDLKMEWRLTIISELQQILSSFGALWEWDASKDLSFLHRRRKRENHTQTAYSNTRRICIWIYVERTRYALFRDGAHCDNALCVCVCATDTYAISRCMWQCEADKNAVHATPRKSAERKR